MAELLDGALSTQKVRLDSLKPSEEKKDQLLLTYTRLDSDRAGSTTTMKVFTATVSATAKALLKSLKAGDEFVLVKVKSGKFWNFSDAKPITEWVEPAPRAAYTGGGSSKAKEPWNDNKPGATAGGIMHDAVALATTSKGTSVTVADVARFAKDLVNIYMEVKESIERSGYKSSNSKLTETITTTSSEIDDLDSISAESW